MNLRGRWAHLRPLTADDMTWLYGLATDMRSNGAWRLRGGTSSPDELEQAVRHSPISAVLCRASDGARVGLLEAYRLNRITGIAHFAALIETESQDVGWTVEGMLLFFGELFTTGTRKIYFEVPEFNIEKLRSALAGPLELEGCLRDYAYYDGQFHDVHICCLSYATWTDSIAPLIQPNKAWT